MANGTVAYQGGGISRFVNKITDVALTAQYQLGMSGLSVFPFVDRLMVEHLNVMCESTSLPGARFSTATDTTYHGITSKMAYRRDFSDLNCTFYVDTKYDTIKVLESWMEYIHAPEGFGGYIGNREGHAFTRFRYTESYKCNINLLKFNKNYSNDVLPPGVNGSSSTLTYTFINAFPINLSSMSVSYGPSDVLKCTVDFAYDRYVLNEVEMKGSKPVGETKQDPEKGEKVQKDADPNKPPPNKNEENSGDNKSSYTPKGKDTPKLNSDGSYKKVTDPEILKYIEEERNINKGSLNLY